VHLVNKAKDVEHARAAVVAGGIAKLDADARRHAAAIADAGSAGAALSAPAPGTSAAALASTTGGNSGNGGDDRPLNGAWRESNPTRNPHNTTGEIPTTTPPAGFDWSVLTNVDPATGTVKRASTSTTYAAHCSSRKTTRAAP